MGLGRIHWRTYIYTYNLTHVDASAKLNKTRYAETCAQASTTCVCSDDSTHNLFKLRQGTLELEADMF